MNTNIFLDTLKELSAIPEADRKTFASIADDLSEEDRGVVAAQLIKLNADLLENQQKHASRLKRGKMITDDIKDHDMPALEKLTNA